MHDVLEAWFASEILPHEAALMRYLARQRGRTNELDDLRHDIYIRVLEAAQRSRPTAPKAFLFMTAKNLMIDRARHASVIPFERILDFDSSNVLVDDISAEREVSGWQQLQRVARLFDRLSPRCREVFWKRRIEGHSTREVSQQLGMAEATVEKHLYNALQQLSDAMYGKTHQTAGRRLTNERADGPAEQDCHGE